MRDFWAWSPFDEKDAAICEEHRRIFEAIYGTSDRYYLNERIHKAQLEESA